MERGSLVLNRKVGQKIVIGRGDSRIEVLVEAARESGAATLRVTAPKVVPVGRDQEKRP